MTDEEINGKQLDREKEKSEKHINQQDPHVEKQANAKSTCSYFFGPTFISIIMQLLDLVLLR